MAGDAGATVEVGAIAGAILLYKIIVARYVSSATSGFVDEMKRASIPSKSLPKVPSKTVDLVGGKKIGSAVRSRSAMNLQQLREHVRKTQGDVARKAAVTQPQLSRIEGRRDHLVSTLRKYVRALGGDIRVVAEIGVEQIVLLDV
jgi:hypothetical protein